MTLNSYWNTGLYGCFEDGKACIDNCLCHCCELSRQCMAIRGQSNTFSWPVLLITPCCFSYLYWHLRRAVINKYHIYEHPALSALTVVCCGACSHCQVHRELTARKVWPGSTMRCIYQAPSGYTEMR